MIKHESCPVAGLLDRALPGAAVSLSMINWAGNGYILISDSLWTLDSSKPASTPVSQAFLGGIGW